MSIKQQDKGTTGQTFVSFFFVLFFGVCWPFSRLCANGKSFHVSVEESEHFLSDMFFFDYS